jgi:pimeloyl-ACP methyl ester carboxylesterase
VFIDIEGRRVHAATGAVPVEGRDDPLVVLLHGAGMDRTVWSQQTRFLAHHGYRAVAVDLPGHGLSDGPAVSSIADAATWVAALIDKLAAAGDTPVHLVGHSMGALIALHAAAHHGGRVASAALIGVAASMPVHPDLQAAADADDPKAAALITAWGHGPGQQVGEHPTPGLWMLGGARALLENAPPGVLATDLRACAAYDGALDAAATVQCPVTLLLGTADKMTPRRAAQPLIDALTDPSVVELDGVGHMGMQEAPAEVRAALLDHLAR